MKIKIDTRIRAPIKRIFDLTRSIDLHKDSVSGTDETVIAGRFSGLIELHELVTFQGWHFGIRQKFTAKITAIEPPLHFRDEMIAGSFKSFCHDHHFTAHDDVTVMCDILHYECPFGFIGRICDGLLLRRHLAGLLTQRGQYIKRVAESDEWVRYLGLSTDADSPGGME